MPVDEERTVSVAAGSSTARRSSGWARLARNMTLEEAAEVALNAITGGAADASLMSVGVRSAPYGQAFYTPPKGADWYLR